MPVCERCETEYRDHEKVRFCPSCGLPNTEKAEQLFRQDAEKIVDGSASTPTSSTYAVSLPKIGSIAIPAVAVSRLQFLLTAFIFVLAFSISDIRVTALLLVAGVMFLPLVTSRVPKYVPEKVPVQYRKFITPGFGSLFFIGAVIIFQLL